MLDTSARREGSADDQADECVIVAVSSSAAWSFNGALVGRVVEGVDAIGNTSILSSWYLGGIGLQLAWGAFKLGCCGKAIAMKIIPSARLPRCNSY